MAIIEKKEIEYIKNLIDRGRESTILDFKREWYKLNKQKYKEIYRESIYEFIKDCLSFLNVGMEIDKYIIIGISENKKAGVVSPYEITERYEENNLQELITEFIDPIPQIDIITKIKVEEYEVDIIKIRKENKDQPYLFKKSFQYQQNDKFEKLCTGLGYIRHGSSSHAISRNELTNMFFKKQGNIYGYLNYNLDIKYDYFIDIMAFLDCMDSMINRYSLDIISNNNMIFRSKLMSVFNELIIEGKLFVDNVDRDNIKEYVCKMILDNKNDYSKLKEALDCGENSLIILMLCACYCWYKLSTNTKINCNITNDVIIITFEDEMLSGDEYREIDKIVVNLNKIINDTDSISLHYSKNINIFKVSEIKYNSESSKYFVQSNIKFKVSEDIIPLLIDPLYKQSNKIEIALREMLQNSIDACKLVDEEVYVGEIKINIRKEQSRTLLSFEDNGIGMDLDDIGEYYLTVGKSKKSLSNIPVVGQFGIGALSMFLIGKKAVVKTKKSNDNEYRFELFEDKKRVSDLTKKICDSTESYTKIEIELTEGLRSEDLEGLIKELSIDKWVINKENIKVKFSYGNTEYNVPNINYIRDRFIPIHKTEDLVILLYDTEKENEIEKNRVEHINLEKVIKTKGIILYNDILIKGVYNFDNYINLNKANIPFIVIVGKTKQDEISIELSRNSANIGGVISKSIVKRIYQNEINKVVEYINENQGKTNSIKMKNEITQLVKSYIKLPTLLLRKNEIFIANTKIYNNISSLSRVWVIYSNSLNDECINFNEGEVFIIDDINSNKSSIADMITSNEVVLISTRFLYKYILYANGSNNGFRMNALKILLKDMIPHINWELSYVDLWKTIEDKYAEIQEAIESKSLYSIYCFGNFNKDTVSKIFSEKIQQRDLIVSIKNIEDYSIKRSYDEFFDDLFIQSYSQQNSDVFSSVAATLYEE